MGKRGKNQAFPPTLARPSLAQVNELGGHVDWRDSRYIGPAWTRRAEETSDFPDKTRD
jgi:hypothetical protein